MTDVPLPPALRENTSDRAVTGLRAITSAIDVIMPGAGSLFGELAGVVIPNQRGQRLVEYVARLGRLLRDHSEILRAQNDRVEDLESAFREIASKLGAEQVALFEAGARSSAQTTSRERIAQIAKIVAEGLTSDDAKTERQRRMLEIVSDLSDLDVLTLSSLSHKYMFDREWQEANHETLHVPPAVLGGGRDAADLQTEHSVVRQRLLNRGLLEQEPVKDGKSCRIKLSSLGRLALRRMGVLADEEV